MTTSIMPELGREVTLEACGRTWRIARMSIDVLESFMDWLRPQLPDPFDGLDKLIAVLPPDKAMELVREAKQEKRGLLDYNSPDVQRALASHRGKMHLFLFMLQAGQKDAKLQDAIDIADEVGAERLTEIFTAAAGKGRGGKAEAPASGASPVTSTGEKSVVA